MPKDVPNFTASPRPNKRRRPGKPPAKVPGAGLPRMGWTLDTDQHWEERSLESKNLVLIGQTIDVLRGIAACLYNAALFRQHARDELVFLATSATSAVHDLEQLQQAWRAKWEIDDSKSLARCEAKERKERAAKRAAAGRHVQIAGAVA